MIRIHCFQKAYVTLMGHDLKQLFFIAVFHTAPKHLPIALRKTKHEKLITTKFQKTHVTLWIFEISLLNARRNLQTNEKRAQKPRNFWPLDRPC